MADEESGHPPREGHQAVQSRLPPLVSIQLLIACSVTPRYSKPLTILSCHITFGEVCPVLRQRPEPAPFDEMLEQLPLTIRELPYAAVDVSAETLVRRLPHALPTEAMHLESKAIVRSGSGLYEESGLGTFGQLQHHRVFLLRPKESMQPT